MGRVEGAGRPQKGEDYSRGPIPESPTVALSVPPDAPLEFRCYPRQGFRQFQAFGPDGSSRKAFLARVRCGGFDEAVPTGLDISE